MLMLITNMMQTKGDLQLGMCLHLTVEAFVGDLACKTAQLSQHQKMSMWQQQKRIEAIWLDRLVMEMRLTQSVINFYCDSQIVLHLGANQVMDSKVKHIDIKFHFIKRYFGKFHATLCYYASCAWRAQVEFCQYSIFTYLFIYLLYLVMATFSSS